MRIRKKTDQQREKEKYADVLFDIRFIFHKYEMFPIMSTLVSHSAIQKH